MREIFGYKLTREGRINPGMNKVDSFFKENYTLHENVKNKTYPKIIVFYWKLTPEMVGKNT